MGARPATLLVMECCRLAEPSEIDQVRRPILGRFVCFRRIVQQGAETGPDGFLVDAVVSRQMVTFLPDLQAIRDAGVLGSVVVVHLGTNGPFTQQTLDQLMALLADVPIVIALTGKADRGWVAGNNEKVRALPAVHPNVTVIDWDVLSAGCEGRCFYDDGIHLTQEGQHYYTSLITRVLGLA